MFWVLFLPSGSKLILVYLHPCRGGLGERDPGSLRAVKEPCHLCKWIARLCNLVTESLRWSWQLRPCQLHSRCCLLAHYSVVHLERFEQCFCSAKVCLQPADTLGKAGSDFVDSCCLYFLDWVKIAFPVYDSSYFLSSSLSILWKYVNVETRYFL